MGRPTATSARATAGSRVVSLLYTLTVPGVVLHELAHQFVAEVLGLEVREVDYTSHVVHEAPRTVLQALLVGLAPLVVNSAFAVGALWAVAGTVPVEPAALARTPETAAALLAAFVLLFRAVPSTQDVANIFSTARRRFRWYRLDVVVAFLLLSPLVVPLYVLLWTARVTNARVVVDLGYAALAFAVLLGARLPAELA